MKHISTRRVITRFFLVVATVVVLAMVTLASCTVLYTQIRMGLFYNSIENAEEARDWNQEQVYMYSGQVAKHYQYKADYYDAKITYLEISRTEMMSSSNPIIRWAAKDQFEVLTLFMGLILTLISFIAWFLFKRKKRCILNVEEKLFNSLVYCICALLTIVSCALFLVFRKAAMAQKPRYKKPTKRCHKKTNSKVISIAQKWKLG